MTKWRSPRSLAGSYASGFLLPAGLLVNGAVVEVELAGIYSSTEASRILELIVEPDYDPDAAFVAAKALGIQTAALSSTGGVEEMFSLRMRIVALGFDTATSEWVLGVHADHRQGQSGTSAETNSSARSFVKRIPNATIDLRDDHLWNVRFRTDDFGGSALGTTGNPSASAQDGASSVFEARSFVVRYWQGAH